MNVWYRLQTTAILLVVGATVLESRSGISRCLKGAECDMQDAGLIKPGLLTTDLVLIEKNRR